MIQLADRLCEHFNVLPSFFVQVRNVYPNTFFFFIIRRHIENEFYANDGGVPTYMAVKYYNCIRVGIICYIILYTNVLIFINIINTHIIYIVNIINNTSFGCGHDIDILYTHIIYVKRRCRQPLVISRVLPVFIIIVSIYHLYLHVYILYVLYNVPSS